MRVDHAFFRKYRNCELPPGINTLFHTLSVPGVYPRPLMDVSLARYKPRRLKTEGIPLAIALNPGGDHLAVGCSNGDICFWRLPLDDDAAPAHKVCICEWSGVEVSSVLWLSDRLVAVGRRNGLIAVVKLDYVSALIPTASIPLPHKPTEP